MNSPNNTVSSRFLRVTVGARSTSLSTYRARVWKDRKGEIEDIFLYSRDRCHPDIPLNGGNSRVINPEKAIKISLNVPILRLELLECGEHITGIRLAQAKAYRDWDRPWFLSLSHCDVEEY